MANHAMNAIKKLGSSSLRVVSDFALSALMDKQTANLIFGALGKGPNLRFHEREIKSIESQFNKVLRNAFIPVFGFSKLDDKDAGCSLVIRLDFMNTEYLSHLKTKYDMSEVSNFFLVIKKQPGRRQHSVDLPPILRFLERPYDIIFELVWNNTGAYTNYKQTSTIAKHKSGEEFICFFDFIGTGNTALSKINAYLKDQKTDMVKNESFINDITARKILFKCKDFLNPKSKSSPLNPDAIPNDFDLLALIKKVDKNKPLSNDPIDSILDDLLKEIKTSLSPTTGNISRPRLSTKTSGHVLEFKFTVPLSTSGHTPQNNFFIDLKTGKCELKYKHPTRLIITDVVTKHTTVFDDFKKKLLDGDLTESKANEQFIEYIIKVIKELPVDGKSSLTAIFNS